MGIDYVSYALRKYVDAKTDSTGSAAEKHPRFISRWIQCFGTRNRGARASTRMVIVATNIHGEQDSHTILQYRQRL